MEECPVHELTLVVLDRLPLSVDRLPDHASMLLDARHGRAGIFLGIALVLGGFLLPFVESRGVIVSGLEMAIDGASNLWLTPAAAFAQLWILSLRRERATMRAARGAIFALSAGASLPILYTTRRIALMAASEGAAAQWMAGLFVMVAGLVLAGVASLRLGVYRASRRG